MWLHVTARDCIWLHVTARDFQPTFIKTSTFRFSKFNVWLNFLSLSSLSHKVSVFLLELPLGQEVFHRRPSHQYFVNNHRFSSLVSIRLGGFSSIDPYPIFLLKLLSSGGEGFSQWHQLLRLVNFFTRLRCSHWSPGFPSQSTKWVGRFFIRLHSHLHVQWSSHLMGKTIVIIVVTEPIDHGLHVIWSHELSSFLVYTWFFHFILQLSSLPLWVLLSTSLRQHHNMHINFIILITIGLCPPIALNQKSL